MVNSFIYHDIYKKYGKDILGSIGYFETKTNKPIYNFKNCNLIKCFDKSKFSLNSNYIVGYYCGSFSFFHMGHTNVIKQFLYYLRENYSSNYLDGNYCIIISPANSDYLIDKYGNDYIYNTNKFRFDNIMRTIKQDELLYKMYIRNKLVIDLNPMLNNYHDYNFTDLINDFCKRNNTIESKKYLLCGKDKYEFKLFEKYSNYLKTFFVDAILDNNNDAFSSSKIFKDNSFHYMRNKKDLYLRVWNREEYYLFTKYFKNQYKNIKALYIHDEFKKIKKMSNIDFTICKDYKEYFPYIKLSRCYDTPLDDNSHDKNIFDSYLNENNISLLGKTILDSDFYSGSTKKFLEDNYECKVISLYDFRGKNGEVELLDIDDFYDDDFYYPNYDISSKCSMDSFNYEMHIDFLNFKKELKRLKNGID